MSSRAPAAGGHNGIGRAVAIAFAREGADVLTSYLDEHDDAQETARWVELAGRKAVLVPGDLADAAQQMTHDKLEDITDGEWDRTLAVNLSAFFYLTKAALSHMRPGSSIIGTSSVNSDSPTPTLLPYDVTKEGTDRRSTSDTAQGPLGLVSQPGGHRAASVWPPSSARLPSDRQRSWASCGARRRSASQLAIVGTGRDGQPDTTLLTQQISKWRLPSDDTEASACRWASPRL